MKRPLPYLVAALVAVLFLAACGAGTEPQAATVGSTSISRADLEDELRVLAENKKFADSVQQRGNIDIVPIEHTLLPDVSSQWVNLLMNQSIIDREFTRRGLEITPEQRAQGEADAAAIFGGPEVFADFPQWFQDEMTARNARVAALAAELPSVEPTEAELREFFQQAMRCEGDKYLQSIAVPTEDEARLIMAQLQQGVEFATLARERSTNAATAQLGGIKYCVLTGDFGRDDEAVKAAAVALSAGTDPNPVKTASGYEIVQVQPWSFENVRPLVEQRYANEGETPLSRFLNRELVRSDLWLDPRYGRLRETGGTVIVEAPSAPEPKERPTPTSSPFAGIPNP